WISGQALNGFIASSLHKAPMMLVMHRNGIQLSGTTARIMNKDPRPIVKALGLEGVEIRSLHHGRELFDAYKHAYALAREGKPSLIYPVGFNATVHEFAAHYGIVNEAEHFCQKKHVAIETTVKVPGSLMSYRDPHAMLECLFYVNELPGGEAHHDGGMKGPDPAAARANPMLQISADEQKALDRLKQQPKRIVVSKARPKP